MSGKFERYQSSKMTAAEETSQRLAEAARKLLEESMAHTGQRPHKWARGREKWEAQQLGGQIAAGVVTKGRGRPRKVEDIGAIFDEFMEGLTKISTKVQNGEAVPGLSRTVLKIKLQKLESAGALSAELAMAAKLIIG